MTICSRSSATPTRSSARPPTAPVVLFAPACTTINVPAYPCRYVDAMFVGFAATTSTQTKALSWFVARVRSWQLDERALVVSGSVGTGKTHLMAAWIRALCLQREIDRKFVEFSHLSGQLKAGFDAGYSEHPIIAPLVDIPVLVIDELGKSLKTEWQMRKPHLSPLRARRRDGRHYELSLRDPSRRKRQALFGRLRAQDPARSHRRPHRLQARRDVRLYHHLGPGLPPHSARSRNGGASMKFWLDRISFADSSSREQRIYARNATQAARVISEELTSYTDRGIVGVHFAQTRESA